MQQKSTEIVKLKNLLIKLNDDETLEQKYKTKLKNAVEGYIAACEKCSKADQTTVIKKPLGIIS